MSLSAALGALASTIADAVNAAGIAAKGQVGPGYPVGTEIVEILANADREWQISVYPLPGGETEPVAASIVSRTTNVPQLTAAVAGTAVTLGGTVVAGVPVHIGIANLADVAYVTQTGDTLASIAAALAAEIVGFALPGISATAAGPTVTVTGVPSAQLAAAVGTTSITRLEVNRVAQHLRATIWAPDDGMRQQLEDAILASVGTADAHSIALGGGLPDMDCELARAPEWSDQSSPDYSVYVSHLTFACEYSVVRSVTTTSITAGIASSVEADGTTRIRYTFGGAS